MRANKPSYFSRINTHLLGSGWGLFTTGLICPIRAVIHSCPSESFTPASAPSSSRTLAASLRSESRKRCYSSCQSVLWVRRCDTSEDVGCTHVCCQVQRSPIFVICTAARGAGLQQQSYGTDSIILCSIVERRLAVQKCPSIFISWMRQT